MAGFGGGGETYEIAGEEENLCLLFVEPCKERVAQIRTHGADGGTLFKRDGAGCAHPLALLAPGAC